MLTLVAGGYIIFNLFIVFLASWLYLQGGRNLVKWISPSARRERKARAKHEEEKNNNSNVQQQQAVKA